MTPETSATIEAKPEVPRIPKYAPATTVVEAKTRNGAPRTHIRAYTVDESISKPLAALADEDCYKCLGSGIKDFRAGGTKARVCRCVLDKQAAADASVQG